MINEIHIVEKNNNILPLLKSEKENIIIFNEEFYNGNVSKNVGSDSFWKKRYAYFEKKGISKLHYFDNTIKPLTTIQFISNRTNLFLWFSNTEHNKINLAALLTYLLSYYRKDINYYLITTNSKINNIQEQEQHKIRLSRNKLLEEQKKWETFVNNKSEL